LEEINHPNLLRLEWNGRIPNYKLEKVVDVEEIQTFTAGEIINYLKCPYFYQLRELWNFKPELAPLIGYGNTLHYCLRYASELIQKEELDPITAITTAIDRSFYLPFASEKTFEAAKKAATKTLVQFAIEHEEDLQKIKEVECRLEFPLQRATIAGKIDVILHDDEMIEVRDYKTSDAVTTKEESELQVRLYALGLKMLGEPVRKASLAYLDNGRIEEVSVAEKKLNEAKTMTEKRINEILERKFEPKPAEFCMKCDYVKICRWCETNGK
ncbi:MAG: PD-(D/E)XK nuclease family protein, partial [Promethearchaeota archaeon]